MKVFEKLENFEADISAYANQMAGVLWDRQLRQDCRENGSSCPENARFGGCNDRWIDMDQCKRCFQFSVDTFPMLYTNMMRFLQSSEMDDWVHNTDDVDTRVRVVRSGCLWNSVEIVDSLCEGDFEGAYGDLEYGYEM